jgi:methionine-rich copper-binding protein CopC
MFLAIAIDTVLFYLGGHVVSQIYNNCATSNQIIPNENITNVTYIDSTPNTSAIDNNATVFVNSSNYSTSNSEFWNYSPPITNNTSNYIDASTENSLNKFTYAVIALAVMLFIRYAHKQYTSTKAIEHASLPPEVETNSQSKKELINAIELELNAIIRKNRVLIKLHTKALDSCKDDNAKMIRVFGIMHAAIVIATLKKKLAALNNENNQLDFIQQESAGNNISSFITMSSTYNTNIKKLGELEEEKQQNNNKYGDANKTNNTPTYGVK